MDQEGLREACTLHKGRCADICHPILHFLQVTPASRQARVIEVLCGVSLQADSIMHEHSTLSLRTRLRPSCASLLHSVRERCARVFVLADVTSLSSL